jgi:hypothetical protein
MNFSPNVILIVVLKSQFYFMQVSPMVLKKIILQEKYFYYNTDKKRMSVFTFRTF